ncbi:jg10560 [Pararge aegeria aegeria]|uniref:Jg10560 protein n=1 Tax=Pararge aegeria aegeria TaxID=348720 RepID=A0A8S4R9R1_9NEOP|nr:jg10560 [Pararge aegeria aegeria]
MSADVLSDDFKSRLHLTTKTVGQDRIRRARENNEDVAILSMFLPNATAERENKKFCCAMKDQCLLGDSRKTIAGHGSPLTMRRVCGVDHHAGHSHTFENVMENSQAYRFPHAFLYR